jgi:hypothetical protein
MGVTSSTSRLEGEDVDVEDAAPVTLDEDTRQMNAIGAPASQTGGGSQQKRARRYTRSAASTKSAAKSKGHYAAVRKTRRR